MRCPQIYSPVCGGDGQTHPSRCHLQEAACLKGSNITVKYEGACKPGDTVPQPQPVEAEQEEEECPEFCIFSYEPVCGTGRHCTSLYCAIGSVNCSDGETYSNECALREATCNSAARVVVAYQGECTAVPVRNAGQPVTHILTSHFTAIPTYFGRSQQFSKAWSRNPEHVGVIPGTTDYEPGV